MEKKILKLRILLWSGLLMSLVFFAVMKIVPSGHMVYKTNLIKNNFFIKKITPIERVQDKNKIIANPVYFSLFTPRKFDSAKLTIKYLDNLEKGIIETGVLVDNKTWSYRLAPLQNSLIDEAMLTWQKIYEGDKILLQRENKFESINDFLSTLPSRDEFAVYNIELNNDYIISDYKASEDVYEIKQVLRGSYEYFTYIKDEDLNFDFSFQDINQNRDSDDIDFNLYYNNQIIETWHLDDDGNKSDNQIASKEINFKIVSKNLPEGVYKIGIKANDDILTKQISTTQSKLSFAGNLRLEKAGNSNINIFCDGQELSVKTVNPDSLQTLLIDDEALEVNETYKQFTKKFASDNFFQIKIEKDGIILASDGIFAFDAKKMINPSFKKVDKNLNLDSVDYILAKYNPVLQNNEYKTTQVDIDLTGAYREKGKYSFIISVPDLEIEDGQDLEIKEIKIELIGKNVFQKIREILN